MTLKERINAKESKIGKIFKTWITYFFALLAALGATLDFAQLIPHDWIPEWIKYSLVIASVLSRAYGQLTVDPNIIKEKTNG